MEFKDLATKFEGLTAEQVGVLAEFGKDILNDAGIFCLPSCLLGLIPVSYTHLTLPTILLV